MEKLRCTACGCDDEDLATPENTELILCMWCYDDYQSEQEKFTEDKSYNNY